MRPGPLTAAISALSVLPALSGAGQGSVSLSNPPRDWAVGEWVSDNGPIRAVLVVNPNETYYFLKYIPGELHSRIKEFGVCRMNGPMLAMKARRLKLEWPVAYTEDPESVRGIEPAHSQIYPLRPKHIFAHFHAKTQNQTMTLDNIDFTRKAK